jgi:hypothetical protein
MKVYQVSFTHSIMLYAESEDQAKERALDSGRDVFTSLEDLECITEMLTPTEAKTFGFKKAD